MISGFPPTGLRPQWEAGEGELMARRGRGVEEERELWKQ